MIPILAELAGINPVSTTVYSSGRFSGGTNYVDTLGTILQVPIDNFAIGGALAGNGNTSPGFPGFTYEVDQFLNVGTQSGFFPTATAPLNETDLVTVSIRDVELPHARLLGAERHRRRVQG